ncbi:low molecular weight phosphotyrosine protein phosphatase, partial [Sphaeroforma arctica JP610]
MVKSVLFCCLGNICRSPMAEAVFISVLKEQGLRDQWKVDSAGTAGYHIGSKPDSRSAACCKSHGVPVDSRARQVTVQDFSDFDFVLCMDTSNLDDLQRLAKKNKNAAATISLFGSYDPEGESIIEDPYY